MSDRFEVTGLDIGILVIYLVLSRIIPLLLSGKNESSNDHLRGG